MRSFAKKLVSLVLGLAGVMVLGAGLQPDQGAGESDAVRSAPGKVMLLAQQAESEKVKPAPDASAPKKARTGRPMAAPAPPMERDKSKAGVMGDEPERARSDKMGGGIIRREDEN